MSESHTAYRQKIFKDLLDSVKDQGAQQIEVTTKEGEQFTAKTLETPMASCTVTLLEHEPTFYVNFDLGFPSISGVTFNVSDRDARRTIPSATREFSDVDEAAQWLIDFLKTPLIRNR